MAAATSLPANGPGERRHHRLLVLALLVFAGLTFASIARTLELRITLLGWGPQDYVNQAQTPERYEKNWPNGTHIYDFSLPMRSYRAAAAIGVPPTTLMYPHVLLEVMLFTLGAGFLAHTLFRDPAVTAVCVMLALCSPLVGLNLGRFGTGFGSSLHALFYGYAHAFRLFAVACFLRRWWLAGFGLLALTLLFHFTLGLYTTVFVGAMMLLTPRDLVRPRFLAGAIACAGVAVAITLGVSRSATLNTGALPTQDWLDACRVFQAHFFPASRELYGLRAHLELIPLVALVGCLVGAWRFLDADERERRGLRMMLAGCISAAGLTLAGLAIAAWVPVPLLVKLCLHRSSDLLSLFATFMLARYLVQVIGRGRLVPACLAAFSIAVMIFSRPGLALLPLFVLFGHELWRRRSAAPRRVAGVAVRVAYALAGTGLATVAAYSIVRQHFRSSAVGRLARSVLDDVWHPLRRFDPFVDGGGFDLLVRGGQFQVAYGWLAVLAVGTLLVLLLRPTRGGAVRSTPRLAGLLALCAATVGYARGMREAEWMWRYGTLALDLRAAQDWAREHTAPTALFMIDPAHKYGWRDFSQRSSLGTVREWGMTSFLYDPDEGRYAEGMRRLALFGVDFPEVVRSHRRADLPLGRAAQEVTDRVHETFVTMSEAQFAELARRYDVDYLIDPAAAERGRPLRLPVVFRNDSYVIYALDVAPAAPSASTSRATMRR